MNNRKLFWIFPVFLTLASAFDPGLDKPAYAQAGGFLAWKTAEKASKELDDRIKQMEEAATRVTGQARQAVLEILNELRLLQAQFKKDVLDVMHHADAILTEQQMITYRNVTNAVQETRAAAVDVLNKGEAASRRLIYDAQITTYTALYDLPCRERRPRIFYSDPDFITPFFSGAEKITLRGAYLDFRRTSKLKVRLDGKEIEADAKANSLDLYIPADLFVVADVKTGRKVVKTIPAEFPVNLTVSGLTYQKADIFHCAFGVKTSDYGDLTFKVFVKKPLSYSITTRIWGEYGGGAPITEKVTFNSLISHPSSHSCWNDAPHSDRPHIFDTTTFCTAPDVALDPSIENLDPRAGNFKTSADCLNAPKRARIVEGRPNCIEVTTEIGGGCSPCSVDAPALAYELDLKGTKRPKVIESEETTKQITSVPTTVQFQRRDQTKFYLAPTWFYSIVIKEYRGDEPTGKEIDLAKASPSVPFFNSTQDPITGQVSLTITPLAQ